MFILIMSLNLLTLDSQDVIDDVTRKDSNLRLQPTHTCEKTCRQQALQQSLLIYST